MKLSERSDSIDPSDLPDIAVQRAVLCVRACVCVASPTNYSLSQNTPWLFTNFLQPAVASTLSGPNNLLRS
jgi:hypothetical protein